MNMSRETDLEALDLALPLTPVSDSSLEPSTPSPLGLSIKQSSIPRLRVISSLGAGPSRHIPCRSMSVSVHDGTDVLRDDYAWNRNSPDLRPYPLGVDKFGSRILVAEAGASEAAQSRSTVIFPTPTSVPLEEVQIQDVKGHESPTRNSVPDTQSSPSRPRKDSTQSFGGRSARSFKHGRLPSIPSFSSFSPSIAKSRLRSISLTGKSARRTLSTTTDIQNGLEFNCGTK
ncbi:hypothetical protein BT96DRAFT_671367 [Gymnopus androsaceus JB14]|uniref:Uncharacterized protein n=1 Tax=Gymnopus androsaceus JB14 TaxID=1447944 RepID=A0A6A4IDV5_9AGAR|nr:hypothetical protein BT96DRAFT_671367 [Gymnopus androsaceus JB14]